MCDTIKNRNPTTSLDSIDETGPWDNQHDIKIKNTFIDLQEKPIKGRSRAVTDSEVFSRTSPVMRTHGKNAELSDASTDATLESDEQCITPLPDGSPASHTFGVNGSPHSLVSEDQQVPFHSTVGWSPPHGANDMWGHMGGYPPYAPMSAEAQMAQMTEWTQWQQHCAAHMAQMGYPPYPMPGDPNYSAMQGYGADAARQGYGKEDPESKTTVMLRNLPNNYTRELLLALLEQQGFAGSYDFAYLPIDFKSQAGLGYAFINFVSPAEADRCWSVFEGFTGWTMRSSKVCSVTWGNPLQGLSAHVERYRDSPVMHDSVPEEWKPMLFTGGIRIAFPPPTKPIKLPKLRVRV